MEKSIYSQLGNRNVVEEEMYQGVWKGRNISFPRVFRGHRFTDDECRSLCHGESIEVHNLKGKYGQLYAVKGCLEESLFEKNTHARFKTNDVLVNNPSYYRKTDKKKTDTMALADLGISLDFEDALHLPVASTVSYPDIHVSESVLSKTEMTDDEMEYDEDEELRREWESDDDMSEDVYEIDMNEKNMAIENEKVVSDDTVPVPVFMDMDMNSFDE